MELAFSWCFEFLWHASGYRGDIRGILGVKVLTSENSEEPHLSFLLLSVSMGPDAFTQKLSWRLQLNRVQVPHPIAFTTSTSQVMSMRLCVCSLQVRGGVAHGLRGDASTRSPTPTLNSLHHTELPKWAAAPMGLSKSQTIRSATRQQRHTAGDG